MDAQTVNNEKRLEYAHYTPGDVERMLKIANSTVKEWLDALGIVPERLPMGQILISRDEVKRLIVYYEQRSREDNRVGRRRGAVKYGPASPPPPAEPNGGCK